MPNRPNQHQLEDLSRAKFQLSLPRRWVFRDKNKDYGIDGEVELFDSSDNAQGLIFFVQIKATESENDSTIMKVNFNIETLKYYKKLDIPVLLVRFSMYKDCIYTKWINNIDLFYAKENSKTINVELTQEDLWIDKSSERIEKKLKNFKRLKSGNFNFPIPFSVIIKENNIKEYSKPILHAQIKSELIKYSDYIYYSSKEDAVIEISLDKKELKINICDLCGCSFHNVEQIQTEIFSKEIACDILLGLAISMIHIGQFDHCAKIIFENDLQNKLLGRKDLLKYLLPYLFKSSYFNQVLELIGEIMSIGYSIELDIIATVNILLSSKSISKAKNKAIEHFFIKRLEKSIEIKDNKHIGIAYYNLGNYYRGKSMHFEAVKNYIAAKRFAPIYLKQHYFFSELAGVFFLLGRYKIASTLYFKSIELGATGLTIALYADALMFSGQYEKAIIAFFEYIEITDEPNDEFLLKAISLESIIEDTQIKVQQRKGIEAIQKADVTKTKKIFNKELRLKAALELDLLCGLAWFNLGIIQIEKSLFDQALLSFTMAGLVQNNDKEAWKNSIFCSLKVKSLPGILPLLIRTAYFFNGNEFLEYLYSHIEANKKINDITPLTEAIEQILPKRSDINTLPTIRYLNEKGVFEDIFKNI